MDAKLKTLRVVDLRQILSTANVSVLTKATKGDLVAKILSSKAALDAYAILYPPDDLLAPPEEVDWNAEQPEVLVVPTPAPASPSAPKPPSAKLATAPVDLTPDACTTTETTTTPSTEELELEKRRQRAARFGIPFVEPNQKNAKQPPQKSGGVTDEQLEARAKRFGYSDSQLNGKKRSAQTQEIDPEELERRKKRAERFGLPVKG